MKPNYLMLILAAQGGCTKALQADLDQTTADLSTEVDRSDGTQAAVEAETARVAALEAEVADLRAALTALQTAHDGLAEDVDATNTTTGARIDALETSLASTQTDVADVATAVSDLSDLTDANIGALEAAITDISTTKSVFDDDGKYLGDLYDARLGSITFFDRSTDTLVEAFWFDTTDVNVWTENDDRLYYLTGNCTGTPYMDRDAAGMLGVLDQNNGKVYQGAGNWTTATLRSSKGLWPGAVCTSVGPVDYTVVEYTLKGTIVGSFPIYVDTASLTF